MTDVEPTTVGQDHTPTPMQLQYGEVVDIHITGARAKTGMPDGTVLFEVGEKLITLAPVGSVKVTRSVPADGEPEPGDLWVDRENTTYVAVRRAAFIVLTLLHLADGSASPHRDWRELHKGPLGPIRLVHRPEFDQDASW